jgi:hypothetical protein
MCFALRCFVVVLSLVIAVALPVLRMAEPISQSTQRRPRIRLCTCFYLGQFYVCINICQPLQETIMWFRAWVMGVTKGLGDGAAISLGVYS